MSLAALRHRLVAASTALPLPLGRAALALLSRGVAPARLPTALAAATAFGLTGPARARFCRRVWLGNKLNELVYARLARDPSRLADLVDLAALDALGSPRGLVFASTHLGPNYVAAAAVHARLPETLFLLGHPGLGPRGARTLAVDTEHERAAALLVARRHLRAGGSVYIAPDGTAGPLDHEVPLRGGVVPMSRGAAALARLAHAHALPIMVGWCDGHLRFITGPPIPPAPSAEADTAWLATYLAQVDRWCRELPPENLRLYGSIYAHWRAPAPDDAPFSTNDPRDPPRS